TTGAFTQIGGGVLRGGGGDVTPLAVGDHQQPVGPGTGHHRLVRAQPVRPQPLEVGQLRFDGAGVWRDGGDDRLGKALDTPGEERSHALVRARPAEHLRGNLPRVRIDPHHQGALLFQDRGEQPVREVEASVLRAHPATSSSSSKQGPHSRRPTAIPFTRPYKRSPASGVFLAFERQREGSTEPDSPGAKSVRSHGAPSAIRASPSPAIRRGRAESASIRAAHETLPVATSRLYSAGSATSSPAAPKGATSN